MDTLFIFPQEKDVISIYGNVMNELFSSKQCMSQCTGCKCSCSSVDFTESIDWF